MLDDPVIDEQSVIIPPGGTLLVYSDGLSETVEYTPGSPALPQLFSAASQGRDRNAQALCEYLWQTVGGSSDKSLIQDDFTVVALKNHNAA
jgi:serine phosphatase RsbU (regulator of sigma subunit)